MPLFDLRCTDCGQVIIDLLVKSREAVRHRTCLECGGAMEIVPMSAAIEVKGYSARNGYSSNEPSND